MPHPVAQRNSLASQSYLSSKVFGERMSGFIDRFGNQNDRSCEGTEVWFEQLRRIAPESLSLLGWKDDLGPESGPMFARNPKIGIAKAARGAQLAVPFLIQYVQIHHMYRSDWSLEFSHGCRRGPFLGRRCRVRARRRTSFETVQCIVS